MIITCSACHKRYFLEEGTLTSEGRMVRCVACQHTWMQEPVESKVKPLSLDPADEVLSIDTSRSPLARSLGWLVLALMTLMILGGGYMARQPVVSLWPKAAVLYHKLGIAVERPGAGLSFENVTPQQHLTDGENKILVKGEIVNTSDQAQGISAITLVFSGPCEKANLLEKLKSKVLPTSDLQKGHCVIDKWQHTFKETRLLSGERLSFETAPHRHLPGVTDITVAF